MKAADKKAPSLIRNMTVEEALADARESYTKKRPKCLAAFTEAKKVLPGGNTRTVLFHGPFPFRAERGEGSKVWDVDGHCYTNMLGEYTAGIYGATNPVIREAVIKALDHGINLGAHNRYEIELARLVCSRFPSVERVRFTNSGTEGNLMAISTARIVTKRPKIMVMKGGYHGGVFLFAGGGQPINAPYPFVVARYNDLEVTRKLIHENASELAAILLEPVIGGGGCIPADKAFLAMLREESRKAGAILIFDEVMTSRVSGGGVQKLLGITPDMTTLGKYIGGGMSFGAFGGREDIMAIYDPTRPGYTSHAGTFNNNVLSMMAGIAGLSKVFTPEAAEQLSAKGEKLRARINKVFRDAGVGMQAMGLASLMTIHPKAGPIRNPDDLVGVDDRLRELVFLDLLERGYYIAQRGFIALTLAVSDAEIDGFVDALTDVVAERKGVLPGA